MNELEKLQEDIRLERKLFEKEKQLLLEKYNALARSVKQAELFNDDKVLYPPDIPKNIEGWSVKKRPNQKGWYLQKTYQGFHLGIHVPEHDGGIKISDVRDCISRKLCKVEENLEAKVDARMKARRVVLRKTAEKSAGFTLIELLIILCLMAIIAAIAAPNLTQWKNNYNVKIAAHDIYSAIQKGKLAAVRENEKITITAIADRIIVSFNNPPNPVEIIETVIMPEGVALAHSPDADLRFRPNSLPVEFNEHLYRITGKNRTLNVRVSPAGGVKIE